MSKQAKYTQGPYKAELGEDPQWFIDTPTQIIACTIGGNDKANAERIRLALTCHDPLLAACEGSAEYYEMLERATGVVHGVLEELRAAIKLAKEEAK